ncbi:4803_t:CDS:2, partial [Racocetra fulgida]
SSEALLIPKDISSKKYSSVLAKHIDHLQGKPEPRTKLTAAKFIDNINGKFYSRKPLAQHAHSRFAMQQIVSMVIGKVNEEMKVNEKEHVVQGGTFQTLDSKPVGIDTKSIKFHHVYSEKFLPGHYIEVQSRVNEQIVIRSYTPLEGYEIQARGPFDACDRLAKSLNPRQSILLSAKPRTPYTKLTGTSSTEKTSLLNPDSPDGCWDELYMIADVIDGMFLEDLALSSRGQLTITYCLSEPPSDWEGLQGRINKQIIQDWMNMMQGVFLQFPSETQKNILHSHSIRRDASDDGWSHSPTLKSQPPFMKSHEILQTSLLPYESISVHTPSREPKTPLTQPDDQKDEDCTNVMEHYLEPKPSSKKPALSIDTDLAKSEKSDNLIQGKIIVSGPDGMLVSVEEDLLEMGFNEQNMIILY